MPFTPHAITTKNNSESPGVWPESVCSVISTAVNFMYLFLDGTKDSGHVLIRKVKSDVPSHRKALLLRDFIDVKT